MHVFAILVNVWIAEHSFEDVKNAYLAETNESLSILFIFALSRLACSQDMYMPASVWRLSQV